MVILKHIAASCHKLLQARHQTKQYTVPLCCGVDVLSSYTQACLVLDLYYGEALLPYVPRPVTPILIHSYSHSHILSYLFHLQASHSPHFNAHSFLSISSSSACLVSSPPFMVRTCALQSVGGLSAVLVIFAFLAGNCLRNVSQR